MEKRIDTICSIYTMINKQRPKPDGTARLYIRITIRKESRKIALPIYWPLRCFNEKSKTIEPRMENDNDYLPFLAIIETEKSKYWKAAKIFLLKDMNFGVCDLISSVFITENSHLLVEWMKYKIRQQIVDGEIKVNTSGNHKTSANTVLLYLGKDIDMSLIDSKWLTKYTVWLLSKMSYGGAWARVKDLKTYMRLAEKLGTTLHPDFKNHCLPKPESNPIYLEKFELEKLIQLFSGGDLSIENFDCLRSFLFACFTGLRISDLKRFDNNWIVNNEIIFKPTKKRLTDKKDHNLKIPLIPIAANFLSTLNGQNLVIRSDQKFNERLKTIAKLAGINKNLTTHVARHTFATSLALLDVPVTIISQLLGHKTIASTMIYIHIADRVKSDEMQKLQNAFSSFSLKLA